MDHGNSHRTGRRGGGQEGTGVGFIFIIPLSRTTTTTTATTRDRSGVADSSSSLCRRRGRWIATMPDSTSTTPCHGDTTTTTTTTKASQTPRVVHRHGWLAATAAATMQRRENGVDGRRCWGEKIDDTHQRIRVYCPIVEKNKDSDENMSSTSASSSVHPSYAPCKKLIRSRLHDYERGTVGQRRTIVEDVLRRVEFLQWPDTTTPLSTKASQKLILKAFRFLIRKKASPSSQKKKTLAPRPDGSEPATRSPVHRLFLPAATDDTTTDTVGTMAPRPPIDPATCPSAKNSDPGTDTCKKLRVFYELYRASHPSDAPYKKLLHSRRSEYETSDAAQRERVLDELVGRIEFTLLPGKSQLNAKASRNKIASAFRSFSRCPRSIDIAPVCAPDAASEEETRELSLLTTPTPIAKKKVSDQPVIPQTIYQSKGIVGLESDHSNVKTEKNAFILQAGKPGNAEVRSAYPT